MRALDCQLALLEKPHGSALFQQGDTKVMCAVYGPAEVKVHKEIIDKATVECIVKPKVGLAGVAERHLEEIISNTCEEMILTTLHPRSAMQIVFQIMQDSGSLISCLLNSACMSMVHAGLPMKSMFVSVCCAITRDDEYICDPNEEREKECKCMLTFAFETRKFDLLSCYTKGEFTIEEYFKCLQLARVTSEEISSFQRLAIERFLSKDVVVDDEEDNESSQEITDPFQENSE